MKRNTKEELLNAAIDLFAERGFSAVSVRDITGKAGVNESTLYIHFKNKDDVLDVILELFRREFGQAFAVDAGEMERRLSGGTAEAYLHHHVLGLRDRLTPDVLKIWRIIYMEVFRNERVRAFYVGEALRASSRFYEKAFGMMMEKGMIRRSDPRLLSDEFNYGLVGLQMENMLLLSDGADTAANASRIFAHIKFLCDMVKVRKENEV